MIQAETTPSTITLTKKGERAVAEHANARALAIHDKKAIAKAAADEVERLLSLLDRLDGDPDLEPAGDEHEPTAAGWTPLEAAYSRYGALLDEAEEDDPPEDDGNAEPSLGSLENHPRPGWGQDYYREADQTLWGHSARQDREQECEDEGAGEGL